MLTIEMKTHRVPEADGIIEYHLRSGNKHLLLSVNRTSAFAETKLTNTTDARVEGATTALYTKAREVLQQEAAHCGPITYRISTGFRPMKAWLQTSGNDIFHWEHSYSPVEDSEKLIAETTIKP